VEAAQPLFDLFSTVLLLYLWRSCSVELYIACAEHDDLAPLPMVAELQGLFTRAGVAGEIEMYSGVHHGFAFPQGWCYDQQAAERHWERLLALYRLSGTHAKPLRTMAVCEALSCSMGFQVADRSVLS